MTVKYEEQLAKLISSHPDVYSSLVDRTTLEGVFEWIREAGPKAGAVDLIPLDEFTHEVVVELSETNEFIVFGCT